MQDFITDEWQGIARAAGLPDFESIWTLDIGWFEAPNERRGGWSGVSRLEVELPDGNRSAVFIKRQQNHSTRTWRHPLRGIATFRREFENLQRLQALGIPTLDVLYFAQRNAGGERRAILISRELTGYRSLQDSMADWQQRGFPETPRWREFIRRLAGIARLMHAHRMQHNCFFPKHIFLRQRDAGMDIRLIDFEKTKRSWTAEGAMLRDLDTLNRRSPGFRATDRLRFLLAYHEQDRVNRRVRKTWGKLVALQRSKDRRHLQRR